MEQLKPQNQPIKTYRHGSIRFLMLTLICFIVFGIQYSFDIPQALQEPLQTQLNISESQFNLLYSVFSAASVSTALLFGIMIDRLGSRIMLVSLSICIAIFEYLIALGGYLQSYYTIFFGRILLGLVCESLISVQLTMVSHWFKGKELALAMGIALTSPQIGSAINSIVTPIVYQQTNSLGTPILISALICTLGVACSFSVTYLDKRADEVDESNDIEHTGHVTFAQESESDQTIHCGDIWHFRFAFWVLCSISMLELAVYVPFLDNGNRLLQKRFCHSASQAGVIVMSTYLVAAFISPLLGAIVDKIGERRIFILFSTLVFILGHATILFWPQCHDRIVQNGVILGYMLLGLGYCFYANCIASSIALVVHKDHTGTAFGLLLMIENTALAIFPIISGSIISSAESPQVGYRKSEVFFVSISCLCLILCLGLTFISPHCKKKLDANKHELIIHKIIRNNIEIEITSSSESISSKTEGSQITTKLLTSNNQ